MSGLAWSMPRRTVFDPARGVLIVEWPLAGGARLHLAANFGDAPLEALAPPVGRVLHTEGEAGHNRLGPWSGIWTLEGPA